MPCKLNSSEHARSFRTNNKNVFGFPAPKTKPSRSRDASQPVKVKSVDHSFKQTNKQTKLRGGGETTIVRVNEGGRRPGQVHIFDFCRLFFSLEVVLTLTEGIKCWMTRLHIQVWKPNLGPVVTITPSPLLYHVRTLYIVRYTPPTTHPSQPTYTFNKLQKEKGKNIKGKKRIKRKGKKENKTEDTHNTKQDKTQLKNNNNDTNNYNF